MIGSISCARISLPFGGGTMNVLEKFFPPSIEDEPEVAAFLFWSAS
jgi:hypothetical protein